jgi:uncharacterized OB-fold protein
MTLRNQEFQRPLPGITAENKPFWDYMKKHEFRVQKCLGCDRLFYPPNGMCPYCHHTESEWVKLSGKGKVFSYVIVRRSNHPAFANDVPYVVAIIETDEGIRYYSNVIDCKPEDVSINMPVEVVFEDVTEEITLPKFKPAAKE